MKSMLLAVDFAPIIAPVLEVLNALLWPCIAIVGAVGTIYCIFLGIKIAKSDPLSGRSARFIAYSSALKSPNRTNRTAAKKQRKT